MRIGLLSYPLNNNYGCYLQAYALKSVLESWGHHVTYIHRRHTIDFSIIYKLKYFVKNLLWSISHLRRFPLFFTANTYESEYIIKKGYQMIPFFEMYMSPHTEPIYSTSKLKSNCENLYDAIIVGSDQVWRADLLKDIEDYFLVFLESQSTKRIAYAASFGSSDPKYSNEKKSICGKGYSRFDAVSVREEDGISIIRDFGWDGPTPHHVLDPTFLLDRNQFDILLPKPKITNNLFCYILDSTDNKDIYIKRVSDKLGLNVINIIKDRTKDSFVFPSIETWLQGIRDSRFVITDSFHGMVFCIIFNTPFVVIPNKARGASRFYSLLKKFGLEERIVDENDVALPTEIDIDWSDVNEKLMMEKEISLCFLRNALEM